MDHRDHVNLLRGGIPQPGGVWADLGSGDGAFTLALRELVGSEAEIFSVDKDRSRLAAQERAMRGKFPDSRIHYLHADLLKPLDLPPLDGMVMANVLHFFPEQERVLRHVCAYLKPGGALILVEYNVDHGNRWVPYPLSFSTFQTLAPRAGLTAPKLLATVPSRFLGQVYSAVCRRTSQKED